MCIFTVPSHFQNCKENRLLAYNRAEILNLETPFVSGWLVVLFSFQYFFEWHEIDRLIVQNRKQKDNRSEETNLKEEMKDMKEEMKEMRSLLQLLINKSTYD